MQELGNSCCSQHFPAMSKSFWKWVAGNSEFLLGKKWSVPPGCPLPCHRPWLWWVPDVFKVTCCDTRGLTYSRPLPATCSRGYFCSLLPTRTALSVSPGCSPCPCVVLPALTGVPYKRGFLEVCSREVVNFQLPVSWARSKILTQTVLDQSCFSLA